MTTSISRLFQALQIVAGRYLKCGFSMTSGDRSCDRQRQVSTSRTSHHVNGTAFDAVVVPWDPRKQAQLGALAEHWGYRWGGNFKTGDYANDVVHFDDGRRFRAGNC